MNEFHPEVSKEDVDAFLQIETWERAGVNLKKLEESKEEEVIEEATKVEEEVEVHTCPLCESELQEPISEEVMKEHVTMLLELINESMEEIEGDEEVIAEETEEEDD